VSLIVVIAFLVSFIHRDAKKLPPVSATYIFAVSLSFVEQL